MGKIYNSSGVEVKRPIMGVCPSCGFWKCGGYQHCLRCGQPLRFESYEWDKAHYKEQYKNVDEEIAALESMKLPFVDDSQQPLSERRKEIIAGKDITVFDVAELHKGNLVKIHPDGQRELMYEGVNLKDYDVE